jgi:hypothetical protein
VWVFFTPHGRVLNIARLSQLLELRQNLRMVLRHESDDAGVVEELFEVAVDNHQAQYVLPV